MNEEIVQVKAKVTLKHGNFTLNDMRKHQCKKDRIMLKDQSLVVKMGKGNNLRIYCSTTAFEKIRKQIVKSIQENAKFSSLEHVENDFQKGQVYSEILRVKQKFTRTVGNIDKYYRT